ETITTDSFLSNLSSDYVDYGGNTEHPCFVLPELKAIAVVCMVISPCGLVENVLVMWFLGCRMKLNRVTTTIRNLAFVDFFLLIVCFLLMLSVLTLPAFCFNDSISSYLDLVFLAAGLCQFFGLSSLGLLAAVSVDRCLAVW
ncbi:MAS protein, partial [Indicator maculatus]|nr:MAS protein [Indicator maculatus]